MAGMLMFDVVFEDGGRMATGSVDLEFALQVAWEAETGGRRAYQIVAGRDVLLDGVELRRRLDER